MNNAHLITIVMKVAASSPNSILEAQVQLLASGASSMAESQCLVLPGAYLPLRARARSLGRITETDSLLVHTLIRRLLSSKTSSSAHLVAKTIIESIRCKITTGDDVIQYLAQSYSKISQNLPTSGQKFQPSLSL